MTAPQGKGHVVVFVSGMAGPKHDKALAEDITALGYDVVVYDGHKIVAGQGEALRAAIEQAEQMPHALPGKVAVVGISLAADAAVVKAPFELVTYPGVNHDIIPGGMNYNPAAYKDAFDRTAARLKAACGN